MFFAGAVDGGLFQRTAGPSNFESVSFRFVPATRTSGQRVDWAGRIGTSIVSGEANVSGSTISLSQDRRPSITGPFGMIGRTQLLMGTSTFVRVPLPPPLTAQGAGPLTAPPGDLHAASRTGFA